MIDGIGDAILAVLEVAGVAASEGRHPRRHQLSDIQLRRRVRAWGAMLVLAVIAVVTSALHPAWPAATYLFGGGVAVGVVSLAAILEHRRHARQVPQRR